MNDVLEKISQMGIVPVVVLDDAKDAKPLATALKKGGLPCAEVTFRTDAAEKSIRIMTQEFPEMLIGAGTVLTIEQIDCALDAGAKFIVSPGLNPRVTRYCIERRIPIIPGISNPTDVEIAMELGLSVVKFFPAQAAGGLNMIKSMAAPYAQMKFMPTGGINEQNVCEYLAYDKVIACGGSWMVDKNLIAEGKYDKIQELTRKAVRIMLGLELRNLDADGNLTIGVNHLERTKNYLEAVKSVKFAQDSVSMKNGKLMAIDIEERIGSVIMHLIQK